MLLNKRNLYLGLGIGSLVIAVVMGIVLYTKYGPHRPLNTDSQEMAKTFEITPQPSVISTSTPKVNESLSVTPQVTPEPTAIAPTPAREWMVYEGIDLREQQLEILVSFKCNDREVYIPPFTIIPWYPEVFDDGNFSIRSNNAVAWEHLGIHGLWVHSGLDILGNELTAYPFQNAIERNESGTLHDPDSFKQAVENCLIGSEIRIKQGTTISLNRVVAAVRVPSSEVEEVSTHVMDLVPYLSDVYPDSGFGKMTSPGMLLYFCGRRLNGESYNTNENYWTQSRIIIGFEPFIASELIDNN